MKTEQQLLQAFREGNAQAGRQLYERFADMAMTIGMRYTSSREAAEDVVQDGFVKLLTTIDRFDYRGEGSLKAWVARVVANCALDYVKEHELMTTIETLPETPDEPPEADDAVEKIPPDVLTGMISRLPAGYRTVLNLYVFEHYPHREIARRLGIREQSSASQLHRARKMLRKMINEYLNRQPT